MSWTTDDLVTRARRSGWLPDAGDVAASDLLAWGDECIAEDFTPLLKTGREEFGIAYTDIPLAVGTTRYRLPRRATLRTLRGVTHIDADGYEHPADEVPAMDAWRYEGGGRAYARVYRLEGDEIVLTAAPTSSGESLRVRYYVRASRMVEVSSAAKLTAASDTVTLTVESAPVWLTQVSDADAYIDIVRGDSPFQTIYADLLATDYDAPSVTLDATTPIVVSEISAQTITHARADYVCKRDETCYPPLPQEMHGALSWGIVSRCLEAVGDQRFTAAQARYRGALERLRASAEPRNQDRKPKIINRSSRLRGGGSLRGWR